MTGHNANDMGTQGADGFRDGYRAGCADASGAAQEAVAWQYQRIGSGRWIDCNKRYYEHAKNDPLFITRELVERAAAPVAAASADLDAHGLRALDNCIADLRRLLELAQDYDLDVMQMQSLETAIESMELRKAASTPAAPGIDRSALTNIIDWWNTYAGPVDDALGEIVRRLRALIDASPKGGSDALRVWGTHRPESMPKLFGTREFAELNWYPDEGYDLICMQVVERVQATSAEVGKERCESGSPDCGPVEHWDSDAVPLCARCWNELAASHGAGVSDD